MRLRQLSRKLDVDTEKITRYLKTIDLPCQDDSNAKLSDEQVEILIQKFGPLIEVATEEISPVTEPPQHEEPAFEEPVFVEEVPEVEAILQQEAAKVATAEPQIPETIQSQPEEAINPETDVIRAPKVELTGLKVVGKIELRTPKKKEDTETEPTTEKVALPKTNRVRAANGKHTKNPPRKNTLTPAEQRAREEKIKLRKKKEAEKLAKKKKRENYLKKVTAKEKGKATPKKMQAETIAHKPKATENVGLITKFFNWMRRE